MMEMMVATLTEILERWDSGDGKPYKGSLIDWSAYNGDGSEPPADIGCMCAQGQVLHLMGGWEPRRLHDVGQGDADRETAELLNISIAHSILLRNVNDSVDGAPSIVLTNPEKVVGDQASKLLDFWWHLDQMTDEQWAATWAATWDAARAATWAAARAATWDAARDATRDATWDATRDAAGNAASEIQGAKLLIEQGKPFFFLPMFGFASPDDIPARPANYGIPAAA